MAVLIPGKLILLANPRTASVTATHYFMRYKGSIHIKKHHMPLLTVREEYKKQIKGKEIVAANVRNPWDVMSSWWFNVERKGWEDFTKFVILYNPSYIGPNLFIHPLIDLDFVIRFETLAKDIKRLTEMIGLTPQSITHENKTKDKIPYRELYAQFPGAKDAVYKRFRAIIDRLGYTFDG